MYRHLLDSTDAKTAQQIVYEIYHSSFINQMFTEDYISFFTDSSFDVEELTAAWISKIDEKVQKRLEELYPGRKRFTNNGIQVVLRKPE